MKRTLAFVLAYLAVLAFAVPAAHATGCPNLLNYQGRLADAEGLSVADGPHNFTFALFATPTGGAPIWSESASLTTVDGLFTHLLGSVNPLPVDLFPTNDQLFIETTADGETMTTRTQIVSVGYAHRVNTVDGSEGGSIVGDVNVSGQIDVTGMQSKIRFDYDDFADLPDPTVYEGMFAHVQNDAKAYYAHAGVWEPLANEVHEHTSPWLPFSFAAGYDDYVGGHPSSGFQQVQYRKIGDMVYLRGLAHRADHTGIPIGAVLGTLPVGFRPPAIVTFTTAAGPSAVVSIDPSGSVYSSGSVEYQGLDGVSFSTTP